MSGFRLSTIACNRPTLAIRRHNGTEVLAQQYGLIARTKLLMALDDVQQTLKRPANRRLLVLEDCPLDFRRAVERQVCRVLRSAPSDTIRGFEHQEYLDPSAQIVDPRFHIAFVDPPLQSFQE